MPKRPPPLKPKAKRPAFQRGKQTTTERGYGWEHQQMREIVLREEPLCYLCLAKDPPRYSPSTIADHKIPKAEGGTDDRANYGGACEPCHKLKTAEEAARARGAAPPKRRLQIGEDGWPA